MSNARTDSAFSGPMPPDPGDEPNDIVRNARGSHHGAASFLGVLARNWKLTLLFGVLCAAAAWYLGDRFKQLSWQSEGTLICTPPALQESQKGAYASPNPDTLISLVKQPNNLETLCQEFGLTMQVRDLDKRIRISRPSNSDMIVVSLNWPEPVAGAALLNRLMALEAASTVNLRKKKTEQALTSMEGAIKETRQKYEDAKAAQAAFLTSQAGGDPQAEAARVAAATVTLEASLLAVAGECEDCERRLNGPGAVDATTENGPTSPNAPGGAAGLEPSSPLFQRRTQLRDALETEKGLLAEALTALDGKRQEHEVGARLAVNNNIPRADFDKLTAELNADRQRVQNSRDAIKRYEQELIELPSQAAALHKAQVQQRLEDKRREAASLKSAVAVQRGRAAEAAELLRRAAPLAEKVKETKAELDQSESQAAALHQLHDSNAEEVAILTPAVPAAAPASSTRKMITAAAFAAPMLLFVALLVVREGRLAARLPGAAFEKLGLTVLTPSPAGPASPDGSDAGAAARVFRRIAMRVRDRVADAGPVLLFSSVNGGPEAQRLAFHVSRLLGTSDARVLILDVRVHGADDGGAQANVPLLTATDAPDFNEKSRGGLTVANFLDTASAGLEEALQPTSSVFVDYLHAGPAADPDFLASRQMGDLLKAVAEKYAHIVVLAPPICESLGAESLASWANVVVLSARESGGTPPGAEAAVRSLQEGEAPVFIACCH